MGVESFAGCEFVTMEQLWNVFDFSVWYQSHMCYWLNYVTQLVYTLPIMQDLFTTNNYARFTDKLDEYYEKQWFLPFLNNEVYHSDFERYRNNIMALNSFHLVQWDNDTILFPRETSQFG